MTTAALIGATGAVGEQLLQQLLDNPAYQQVLLFSRRSSGVQHDKLREVITELDQLEALQAADALEPPLPTIDQGFCCLGSTRKKAGSFKRFQEIDCDYVVNFARFCQDLGAEGYSVISAMGASSLSLSRYLRTKGDMELKLRKLGFKQLNIVRPALLFGQRSEQRTMEEVGYKLMKLGSPLMCGPLKRLRPVSFKQVAKSLEVASQTPLSSINIIENEQIQAYA